MVLDVFSFTTKGGRGHNEDSAACRTKNEHGLFLVADGLGGHAYGEVASGCVAEVLFDGWEASLGPQEQQKLQRPQWLSEKMTEANEAILVRQRESGSNMKSTAVALAVDKDKACWTHVGDSRLYFISHGKIRHITDDHSVAFKKYQAGTITRWQINTDEDQSRLLRTLGSPDRYEPTPGPDPVVLSAGDAFLLCSDGIWEYLHDLEVLVDYLKSRTAQDWGDYLLKRVMDRVDGNNDNLSLITLIIS